MTTDTINGKPVHPAVRMFAREFRAGEMSRREFMARATALGATAAAACTLAGLPSPARAQDMATPKKGGTLRIQMDVLALKEPRLYDFSQMGNLSRGVLEYLVELRHDGSFRPVLLESWEVNGNATEYRLKLRPGVKWNNGDDFTAADVVANIEAWCDTKVEGNSMATRLASLVDAQTGRIVEGAVAVEDALTVRLKLPVSDITLIPSFADYPAAVQHRDLIGQNVLDHGVGTGAYRIAEHQVGVTAVLERNPDHTYWGDAYLDRVEFIDFGTDPAATVAAAEAEEFDVNYDSVGDFVDVFDAIGWERSEIVTASTVVIRTNQKAQVNGRQPYADVRVRRALQLAVDNAVLLELGYAGRGEVAENHHVSPLHPEYAQLPPLKHDPAEARRLMEEAGMLDFEHELISIDDDWRRNTADACAAQLRDAGLRVKRTIIPGTSFWNDWQKYPFAVVNWNGRELGVQVYALAYRSDAAWNETAFANAQFDALLTEAMAIADAGSRREKMARLQQILRDEGVIIQPYWRSLYRHVRPGVLNADRHQKDEINIHHLGWA
ncbi:peptide/nickel transport system substrate-binding protein [Rhodovulum imhoffii]|uniref:Peptide/nickel transport system substrate-binding protein n=1 Tax=Rhodovulum imhoffii TaxID=365340 RepID=A0A2T5BTK7_9RHOB|nr:ABC transporter substrate-binding protein [Rhodovulum imhoffii]MBK5934299.1 diguanylate cyclase [Rhodovulum imhoffii]PTN02753.1 peptide/nickel transport system substrate-binding protein [Rhodovulum imhoffii]